MTVGKTRSPRLLDLFCGAGGCAMGYHRAGFEVVGVDINPQPHYPFEFHRKDAMMVLRGDKDYPDGGAGVDPDILDAWHEEWHLLRLDRFDAIHASPPCQAYSQVNNRAHIAGRDYPDLIAPTRDALIATGLPYVIENVEGAPLLNPIRLCGSSFGLAVRRHRLFECSFPAMGLPCAHHLQTEAKYPTCFQAEPGEKRLATVVQVYGHTAGSTMWPWAMGIDWMDRDELAQAIPPAYTEHIGHYLMAEVNQEVAA